MIDNYGWKSAFSRLYVCHGSFETSRPSFTIALVIVIKTIIFSVDYVSEGAGEEAF